MKSFLEFVQEQHIDYATYTQIVNESPQRMKGDAPFESIGIEEITTIARMDDYILVSKEFLKKEGFVFELWKHKKGDYYVLGHFYLDSIKEKERFGVVSSVFFRLEKSFRSEQKHLKNKKVLKINTVHTADIWRRQGLASTLYKYFLDTGHIIMSDSMQYQGAVNLWKGFLTIPKTSVYIYDLVEDKFISKMSKNTDDRHIWSDDASKKRIRLVFVNDK